jgi:hypothetical protein
VPRVEQLLHARALAAYGHTRYGIIQIARQLQQPRRQSFVGGALQPALQQGARPPLVRGPHDDAVRGLFEAAFRFPAPIHREFLLRERKLDGRRDRLARGRESSHGGDLAIDPRREPLHEIAHRMRVDADGHHDFHAASDVHTGRQPPRTRADPNGEWVAGATSLEQR